MKDNTNDDCLFSSNDIRDHSNRGISTQQIYNSTISGNHTENTKEGIYFGYARENIISGNFSKGNDESGIEINEAARTTVTGNFCVNNDGDGIYINDSSDYSTITGNKVYNYDDGVYPEGDDGIRIVSDNVVVSSNNIRSTFGSSGDYGIEISSSADNVYIIGNEISKARLRIGPPPVSEFSQYKENVSFETCRGLRRSVIISAGGRITAITSGA